TLARAGRPDEGLHVLQVALERLAAAGRKAKARLGKAAFEGLVTLHVRSLFELSGVDAEIAVGGAHQMFELVEREPLVDRERAHDPEAQTLMDDAVEIRQHA